MHDTLRSLGLSSTGFTRDDHTLILVVGIHIVVRRFGDAENVRRNFESVLSLVSLKDFIRIYTKIYMVHEAFSLRTKVWIGEGAYP